MKLHDYIQGLSQEEIEQARAEGYARNKRPTPQLQRVTPPETVVQVSNPSKLWWDKWERQVSGGTSKER